MARRRQHRPLAARPLRATSMWEVDQVFLTKRGQRIEVICSLVNDQGGLRNLSIVAPTADPLEAVRYAARDVAGKGNVSGAWNTRVRWAKQQVHTEQDELIRDYQLEDEFLDEFTEVLAEIRDQQK